MVVLPPHNAEREPESHLSPAGALSWCRWTWESTPPGVTYAPSASMICVVDGLEGVRDKVMAIILPDFVPIERPGWRISMAVTCLVALIRGPASS